MCINGSSHEAMAAPVYTVLYTHQKTKKAKVWQDGILKTSGGQQAVLYSDIGQRLDSVYLKTGMVSPGDELESDRYLITVEAVGDNPSSTKSSTENKDILNFSRVALKPIGLRPLTGLKRKFTDFHSPREITKKPSLDAVETAALSSPHLAQGCSSQSPQLYTTSPLFAASYRNQAGNEKQIICSPKHTLVTTTNPDVSENIFHSNISASPKGTVTNGNGDKVVEGARTRQNPRSTAQILALLNTLPSQKGAVDVQLSAAVSTVCTNEVQKTTSITNAPGGRKPCKLPSELSPVRTKAGKSRWDVYLVNSPSSNTTQTDQDDFVVSLSPGKRLDISHTDFLVRAEARQEKARGLDSKTNIENQQQSDSYISEPGLTPESLAVVADEFITDVENKEGAFSEITFNLMDSFDFTELDDSDSTESQPECLSNPTKACAELTAKKDFLQKKSQEKHVDNELLNDNIENASLHETITDCYIATVCELSSDKAKSESTIQTLLKDQSKMVKSGDQDKKAEVMIKANIIQTVGKSEFFPNTADEGHIPSRQVMFSSDDLTKLKILPKHLSDSYGHFGGKSASLLPNANMHHSVQGSNEDHNSPELWPSGSSISLLKSLTEPRNAIESLNVFCAMCPTTTRNTDNDVQACLEKVEEKGQDYRFLVQHK